MSRWKLVVTPLDAAILRLTERIDQRTLAYWAADCAARVLVHFEAERPDDARPREALAACRRWVSGEPLTVGDARRLALAAHAAARDAGVDGAATAAARAAGHALATVHVRDHAVSAGRYAASAARDASRDPSAAYFEREWQHGHLMALLQRVR